MATGGQERLGAPVARSETAKKSELVKELQRLRIQEQNSEKERSTHLFAKHGDVYKELSDLQEQEERAKTTRKAEKQKLQQQLNKIKTMVKKFRRELQDVKPTPEFVEKLKVIMEDIETHISNFKENQREQYDELIRDERIAIQEVSMMNNKFDSWAMLGPPRLDSERKSAKPTQLASHRDVTKDLPPEVAAFERFVAQNGGVRGGWDEYDHGNFLKYRNRHKGKPTFMRELLGYLPTKTEEEIRHHEMWYRQYLDLNEEKKEAIQKWREKKEVERDTVLAVAVKHDEQEEHQELRRKQLLEEKLELEKREKRAQLNKWKVEKELERAEKEERELRQELAKEQKWEEDRKIQEEQKSKVEEFRRQREEEKEQQEYMRHVQQQIEQERRAQATMEVKKFQERDLHQVKKKVAKSKAQLEAEKERQKRIETKLKKQNEAHIPRDPSRLLQPTAGWKERQKDTSRSGGQIMHSQRRAVPTWRQT